MFKKAKRIKQEALVIEQMKRQATNVEDRAQDRLEQGLPFVVGVKADQSSKRVQSKKEIDQ